MKKILLMVLFMTLFLSGHNVKPAYLEVESLGDGSYAIKWKVPLLSKKRVEMEPHFPMGCQEKMGSRYTLQDNMLEMSYWHLVCETNGLEGRSITIDGLDDSMMDVLVHFKNRDKDSYVKRLTSSSNSFVVQPDPSTLNIIQNYLPLGVKHILMGFDHLLFVLGLMLIISRAKVLILTISSFTLAHSITLGLTILELVYPFSTFIEALIALSIVILAVEIIYSYHGKYGLFARYPWSIAFLFGLIHGFGFATVLMELGIPKAYLLTALLSFNLGIELGQLFFIFLLLAVYVVVRKKVSSQRVLQGKVILTYFIGITAFYWLIERVYS